MCLALLLEHRHRPVRYRTLELMSVTGRNQMQPDMVGASVGHDGSGRQC